MADTNERLQRVASSLPSAVDRILGYATDENAAGFLVCDRNARPIGYALEALIAEQGQNMIPTIYARVSKRIGQTVINRTVEGEMAEHELNNIDDGLIIILDDHISNGVTKRMANQALSAVNPRVTSRFVTLTGKGSDFTVYPGIGPGVAAPWRDMESVIGFVYDESGGAISPRPTTRSATFYAEIDKATAAYVRATRQVK